MKPTSQTVGVCFFLDCFSLAVLPGMCFPQEGVDQCEQWNNEGMENENCANERV